MKRLRKVISRVLNLLLEPLLCRIEDRLRPAFATLHSRLEAMERAIVAPFPSTVIKNEMQNIDSLPLALLKSTPDLTVVGHFASDLESIVPGCQVLTFADWVDATEPVRVSPRRNMVFLDEYYFMRAMARLAAPIFLFAESIIVATRFDYLPEMRCRAILHQLGFMEIMLVLVDGLTGEMATFAVSHASPVTCDPLFVDERRPTVELGGPATWLVARKAACYGGGEWPNV
ncbi:MAG TPA: hypothetical protein PLR37_04845 [Candidatus Accumulibacter phosphatis]|nr:hypothetical protein [Candidatus Accumulibacter phosphatis]